MKKKICFIITFGFILLALSACVNNKQTLHAAPAGSIGSFGQINLMGLYDAASEKIFLETQPQAALPEPETTVDMSGDYIGTLLCELPPEDSTYTIYNQDGTKCIVLYITTIDYGNF